MGKASGEARRRRKQLAEEARMILNLTPEMPDLVAKQIKQMGIKVTKKDQPTALKISLSAIMRKAMAGDTKSLEFILNTAGFKVDGDADIEIAETEAVQIVDPAVTREKLDALTDEQLKQYEDLCKALRTEDSANE